MKAPITVLNCFAPLVMTKTFRRLTDGRVGKVSYDNAAKFMVRSEAVDSIEGLHRLLSTLENDPQALIIRGYPVPGTDTTKPINRRILHKDDAPDPCITEGNGARWACADLDKVPSAKGINLITDPRGAVAYLRSNYLPPELRDVRCVVQWSASAGLKKNDIRAHFWFLLDRPMTSDELKAWLDTNSWLRTHEDHIDRALFNGVQPHYVAKPIFENMDDPIRERTILVDGARDVATLVLPADIGKKIKRSAKGKRGKGSAGWVGWQDALSTAAGVEGRLALIGDDGGRKLYGFHRPITSAAAALVYEEGSSCNQGKFKRMACAAIKSAPAADGRAGDIDYYSSDEYLDLSLETAIEKFGPEADERLAKKAATEGDFFDRYLYVENQECFFDVTEWRLVSEKNIKLRHPEIGDPVHSRENAAYVYHMATDRRRYVADVTYWPGGGLIVENGGLKLVNKWYPAPYEMRDGDVGPFMDLVSRIFPDEIQRTILLDKMAYAIQHRGKKPNWHVILFGVPGIGKDTLLRPMVDYFGHNAWSIAADDLTKNFNGFVAHECIVVQELHTKSTRDMLNRLKPWLASPPLFVNCDEKNRRPYQVANLSTWWFTTNEADALKFDNSDRRFCILESPMTAEETPAKGYFRDLHNWLDKGGCQYVVNALAKREISPRFDAQGKAPWTEGKGNMIRETLGSVGKRILAAIENRDGIFKDDVVIMEDVEQHLFSELPHADHKDISDYRIREALKAAGAVSLPQIKFMDKEVECRVRLWAIREQKVWMRLNTETLREAYRDGYKNTQELLKLILD